MEKKPKWRRVLAELAIVTEGSGYVGLRKEKEKKVIQKIRLKLVNPLVSVETAYKIDLKIFTGRMNLQFSSTNPRKHFY